MKFTKENFEKKEEIDEKKIKKGIEDGFSEKRSYILYRIAGALHKDVFEININCAREFKLNTTFSYFMLYLSVDDLDFIFGGEIDAFKINNSFGSVTKVSSHGFKWNDCEYDRYIKFTFYDNLDKKFMGSLEPSTHEEWFYRTVNKSFHERFVDNSNEIVDVTDLWGNVKPRIGDKIMKKIVCLVDAFAD